jgi:filamentous hemagglutinin family protein
MRTKFWLSFLTLTNVAINTQAAQSQTYQPTNRPPVSDNTLGTQITGNGNNFNITGGINRGQTLFHSFTDFSVPTNGQANFLNPVNNRDIITRVTGNLFSDINGTVNTNGANLFLINPNGIVFGTNAQLNVGKAFVGSTANSIDLVSAGGRINFGTNSNGDAPLLSVAPNVLFDVSRLNIGGGNGAISNFGTLQTNNPSQYIGLVGGNVTLDGGKIIAPGGRIDIGGLKNAGTVTVTNNGLVFGGGGLISDVSLINGAGLIVRATGTLDTVDTFFNNAISNGSSINISANNLDILNSGAKLNGQPAAIDAGFDINSGVQTQAAGGIKIDATGKVNLSNSDIKNTIRAGTEGSIGDIKIQAGALDIKNQSLISSSTSSKGNAGNIALKVNGAINLTNGGQIISDTTTTAQGNAGDINIQATGDIKIADSSNSATSLISSDTDGQGDTGKITIDTQSKLILANNGVITSSINQASEGNGKGIFITARELELANGSSLVTDTFQTNQVDGKGNAGDIKIKTTGDIRISGSSISSGSQGKGDTGKITIDTQSELILANNGVITSSINQGGKGNSNGIAITARELELANQSKISAVRSKTTQVDDKGNAGDIKIKTTGDIRISGSQITSSSGGKGDTGKIEIDTQSKLILANNGGITSSISPSGEGNSKGIFITARELELANGSIIGTDTFQTTQVDGKGNAGDIKLKTTGDIRISGSQITSSSGGKGHTGKIALGTQGTFIITNKGGIFNNLNKKATGNGQGIFITAQQLELTNNSFISSGSFQTAQSFSNNKAGDINIKVPGVIQSKDSFIGTVSTGLDRTGNISITSDKLILNKTAIFSTGVFVAGGDITIATGDKLLMRKNSFINSQSLSGQRNDNGGNVTISSPLIIALPGDNNITADAKNGNGGNVQIVSQGLFGIKYRPKGQDSLLTNDITASSTFGQNGNVNISTPGTDPGKDSTELPKVTTDASKQISQVCSASNRENKLTVAGRGGLPPNANDPLTSDAVWQDARAASSQPVISSAKTNPAKLAPPAVGLVFDGKGKVTLVAANTQGQPTGTSVACPKIE